MAGRPVTKLTEKQIEKVEFLADLGMNIEQIGDYLGISGRTFERLKASDERILSAYKRGSASGVTYVTGKLRTLIDKGCQASTMFFLKTQARWREKQDINISSEDGSLSKPEKILVSFINNEKKD